MTLNEILHWSIKISGMACLIASGANGGVALMVHGREQKLLSTAVAAVALIVGVAAIVWPAA